MKKIALLSLMTCLVFMPLYSSLAADMFLKLDGIKGESTDHAHTDEIEVLSWSWGATHSGSINRGGQSSAAGKPGVSSFSFRKYVDKSSPKIILHCTDGTIHREALLTVRKSGGAMEDYLVIKMDKVIISSISTSGPTEDDERITEEVSLNYSKIEMSYDEPAPDGSSKGSIDVTWKLERGEK